MLRSRARDRSDEGRRNRPRLAEITSTGLGDEKLVDQLKSISPLTPAIVFSGAARTCSDDTFADVFLSKSNCSAAQLLDHIRMALVRKRGPKPAVTSSYSVGRCVLA